VIDFRPELPPQVGTLNLSQAKISMSYALEADESTVIYDYHMMDTSCMANSKLHRRSDAPMGRASAGILRSLNSQPQGFMCRVLPLGGGISLPLPIICMLLITLPAPTSPSDRRKELPLADSISPDESPSTRQLR